LENYDRRFVYQKKLIFNLFLTKKSTKQHKIFIKPINGLRKLKKPPQNPKSIGNNFFYVLRYVFLGTFKVNKTPKWNSPHHIESSDTKIIRFGGRN
jgi:site-specific DNA-adenine methylase